jgi:hypothetical protein
MEEIKHKRKPGRTGYRKHKCRCIECRAWNTAYARLYWARRGNRPSNWHSYNARRQGAYR